MRTEVLDHQARRFEHHHAACRHSCQLWHRVDGSTGCCHTLDDRHSAVKHWDPRSDCTGVLTMTGVSGTPTVMDTPLSSRRESST